MLSFGVFLLALLTHIDRK
ncbi:putative holin-like toxin [Lactobacillus colini]